MGLSSKQEGDVQEDEEGTVEITNRILEIGKETFPFLFFVVLGARDVQVEDETQRREGGKGI